MGSLRGRNRSDRMEAAALQLLLGSLGSLPESVAVGLASGFTRTARAAWLNAKRPRIKVKPVQGRGAPVSLKQLCLGQHE